MNPMYSAGDIVYVPNMLFKDRDAKERLDIRIAGHPYIILNDVNDFGDECLALKLTSQKRHNIKQYSLERNSSIPRLKKDSYLDLDKVFCLNIEKFIIPYGHLKYKHLNGVHKIFADLNINKKQVTSYTII